MKKNLLIIGFILFTGCAKKTYQLNSAKITNHLKSDTDSVGQRKIVTIDKSVTTIEKQIDTTITIKGNSLFGYVTAANLKDSSITAHFENEDIALDLSTNNGIIKAIATSKSRKLSLKFNDKITTVNNISTNASEISKLKTGVDIKTDSLIKHEVTHTDPTITVNAFTNIVKWICIVVIILGLLFYLGRKFIPIIR